jgi:hypothetical protein
MKITIDTKEDSPEDIRKVVAMLTTLIGEREKHSNIFDDSSNESGGSVLANIFDSSEKKTDDVSKIDKDEIRKAVKEMDDSPKIIPY